MSSADYEWESEQYRSGLCCNCADNARLLAQAAHALDKLLTMICWCCGEPDCNDCSNLSCEYDTDHCANCCDCEDKQ